MESWARGLVLEGAIVVRGGDFQAFSLVEPSRGGRIRAAPESISVQRILGGRNQMVSNTLWVVSQETSQGTPPRTQRRSEVKLTDFLLAQLEREAAGSRRALERVPEGRPDWKPHDISKDRVRVRV